MEILASEAAVKRIGPEIRALAPGATLTALGEGGRLSREGASVAMSEVDPEVFYLSLDLYPAGLLPYAFRIILGGRNGRFAQLFNAGLDNPAFGRVMDKGLRLAKSSAQAPAIAEYVLAHGLAALHPIAAQRALQSAKTWKVERFREVASTRWILVGFGAIGQEIARRLHPFGAHVTAVRRRPAPSPFLSQSAATEDLLSLVPEADVVVLACALTPETRGLAGAAFFEAMKPGALLINIARGAVVDEEALRAGLERDQPGRAVLDVFQTEPLPPGSWMWDHPKLTLTAHGSNAGDQVGARGDRLFLENLRRYLEGRPLLNEAARSEAGAAPSA